MESNILTHGMPYPYTLNMITKVEALIRQNDCTPLTIAMLNGQVRIELNDICLYRFMLD